MKRVTKIGKRKNEHIKINLHKDVSSDLTSGLENYYFTHEGLPELDLDSIDLSQSLFGKKVLAPILVSSMTGGTEKGYEINRRLATAAQSMGIAMGVGSQRVALEDGSKTPTFAITRKSAPDILLFANLGAIQLNNGYSLDHCKRAIEMIEADALIIHLNPLQEALQEDGNTNFAGLARKIEGICKNLDVPVIAKEIGWGISQRTANILADCGVAGIDVAGAGGTSWSQVEMYRSKSIQGQELAAAFTDWGIPTSDSILNVLKANPKITIFASGGLKDGIDIAKCIALGASMGGMAGGILKAANESLGSVLDTLQLIKRQIQIAMFSCGAENLASLKGKIAARTRS